MKNVYRLVKFHHLSQHFIVLSELRMHRLRNEQQIFLGQSIHINLQNKNIQQTMKTKLDAK